MNKENEDWKTLPSNDNYLISSLGNVKVLKRISKKGLNLKGKNIKPYLDNKGYLCVAICGKIKRVHQLVAEAFLNHIPCKGKIVIDHINNVKNDNRLINLQIISNRENLSKDVKNCSSKYTGVYWNKMNKKWHSQIYINKKSIHLGLFLCEKEASKTYQKKMKELVM